MTNLKALNIRQKLILSLMTNKLSNVSTLYDKIIKLQPHIARNTLHDNLLTLYNTGFINRVKIKNVLHYQLPVGNSSVEPKSKQKPKPKTKAVKSVNTYALEFLQRNIGKSYSAKAIGTALNYPKAPNQINVLLKKLQGLGQVELLSKGPLLYKILPNISPIWDTPDKKVVAAPVMSLEPVPAIDVIPTQLPDFTRMDMSETINSIVKLQQQLSIYQQALNNIASILAQAGIIDD